MHAIYAMLEISVEECKHTKEENLTQVSAVFARDESEIVYFWQEHCRGHLVFSANHIGRCIMSICAITGNGKLDYEDQEVFARFFSLNLPFPFVINKYFVRRYFETL